MTTIALLNVASYVDGKDFTGDSNRTMLTLGRAPLDKTNFRSGGWSELAGGLRTAELAQGGHWSADSGLDAAAWADLAATERVHTIAPEEVEGGVAYFWRSQRFGYQALAGDVGALAGYELTSQGATREGVVRGRLAVAPYLNTLDWDSEDPPAPITYNATGQAGSAVELPAVDDDPAQNLYAAVHILGTPGTTVTLELESDTTEDFDDDPTVRATIGPLTAAGGTWVTPVAGPITHTWWRVNIAAVTGTFTIAVALGVQ
jgi:hypothetical protein